MYGFKKEKREDEDMGMVLHTGLDKTTVLQEARRFNDTPLNPKKCITTLTKILAVIMRGDKLGKNEATDAFFAMTKLFQCNDVNLRRMVYLVIKEMATIADDVIIVTSSLTRDMTGNQTSFRAPAIRALCKITDSTMLQSIERYMKQAIVDKSYAISSAALTSSMHLMTTNPEVVKRWASEVQEAANSDGQMPQYHAIGVMYAMRKVDKLAIDKMIQKFAKRPLKSPYATCLLVRMAAKRIEDDNLGPNSPMFEFLESCLRHKSETVIYEAARAIVSSKATTAKELSPAVSVLQLFCSSPKPALRYAAVRTLNVVALNHSAAVTACNLDLEQMITDSNRSIATLAITTLLKTGTEGSVERLIKQIGTFMNEISDEFKQVVIESVQSLVLKYPRKFNIIVEFLSTTFREQNSYWVKKSVLHALEEILEEIPAAKSLVLFNMCEFIEDLEFLKLTQRIIFLLGNEGPRMNTPGKFIRYIFNRMLLESPCVRVTAVTALAKFGAYCENMLENILVLMKRTMLDEDDEVRDRATFFYHILSGRNKAKSIYYIFSESQYSPATLERNLREYMDNNEAHTRPFNLRSVPAVAASDTNKHSHNEVLPVLKTAMGGAPSRPASEARQTDTAKGATPSAAASNNLSSTLSREERFTAELSNVSPQLSSLGRVFRSCEPTDLTEPEVEYVVRCTKHVFAKHLVLQFDIMNTLTDQLLEDVSVECIPDEEEFTRNFDVKCPSLPFNVTKSVYVCFNYPADKHHSKCNFTCTMKFIVKDCDPNTGEPDDMEGYNEEFPIEAVELHWSDSVQKVRRANFAAAWEEVGPQNQLECTYSLKAADNIPDTIKAIVEHLGMQPCESSDKMTEGKSSHLLLLSGTFRGDIDMVMRAKLVTSPPDGVTMQMQLRCTDAEVAHVVADAIS